MFLSKKAYINWTQYINLIYYRELWNFINHTSKMSLKNIGGQNELPR